MKASVSITGKERSYLARGCDNDVVGSKPFNAVLSLHPNDVDASDLWALTQYIRGMNKAHKRLTTQK